jgi:hypothetical protein
LPLFIISWQLRRHLSITFSLQKLSCRCAQA